MPHQPEQGHHNNGHVVQSNVRRRKGIIKQEKKTFIIDTLANLSVRLRESTIIIAIVVNWSVSRRESTTRRYRIIS